MNRPVEKRFDGDEALVGFNEFPDWKQLKTFLANKYNVLEIESLSSLKLEKVVKVAMPACIKTII